MASAGPAPLRIGIATLVLAAIPIVAATQELPPPVDRKIQFQTDVEPILAERCYECHGEEVNMNGYSLLRKKEAVRGGSSGLAAIEPGNSATSRLIHLVAGVEELLFMPPSGDRLSDEEIGVLRAWIDQGVDWVTSDEGPGARVRSKAWLEMDYGPVISASITVREPQDPRTDKTPQDNISYKGHAVLLGPDRRAGIVFDTELLRYAAGWRDGGLELTGTVYDGKHGPHPWVRGEPVEWARYHGYYVHGDRTVFSYSVGGVGVLDEPGFEIRQEFSVLTRTLEMKASREERVLQVAEAPGTPQLLDRISLESVEGPAAQTLVHSEAFVVGLVGDEGAEWDLSDTQSRLRLSPSDEVRRWTLFFAADADVEHLAGVLREAPAPLALAELTRGGPSRFAPKVSTRGRLGSVSGPYVVDEITLPVNNPWKSRMRPGDFAFFEGEDRAAVSTWKIPMVSALCMES